MRGAEVQFSPAEAEQFLPHITCKDTVAVRYDSQRETVQPVDLSHEPLRNLESGKGMCERLKMGILREFVDNYEDGIRASGFW